MFGECLYTRVQAGSTWYYMAENGVGCVEEGNKGLEGAGRRG